MHYYNATRVTFTALAFVFKQEHPWRRPLIVKRQLMEEEKKSPRVGGGGGDTQWRTLCQHTFLGDTNEVSPCKSPQMKAQKERNHFLFFVNSVYPHFLNQWFIPLFGHLTSETLRYVHACMHACAYICVCASSCECVTVKSIQIPTSDSEHSSLAK